MPTAAPTASAAPKPSRGRARRVAKWVGLVVCMAIAAVWGWSLWNCVWWARTIGDGDPTIIAAGWLVDGDLVWKSYLPMKPGADRFGLRRHDLPEMDGLRAWVRFGVSERPLNVVVPLWIPFLACSLPTALLWWREWRAVHRCRAGQCVKCGYDRAGLTAESHCPECGAASSGGAKAKT